MYVIHFVVDNQKIYLKDPIEEVLVANSVGYLYCDFLFKDQSNWKPELEKKVTFSWGAIKETRKLTVNNGQSSAIEIPFSVIQSPGFTVSIRGEALLDNEPIRITTLPFPVRIKVSGDVDTDINEDIDNLPDGTIETPRQIAEEALKAAEEAKRLSEDAVKNVDAYFQIIVDLKEDTKKLEWVADRYMDFELSTATEISVLKDKTNVHYNELVSAKEKINELLNSLSVIRDNFDSLSSLTDGLSNKIENLFGITDNLGKNSADIKAELLDIINNSINDTQNNLELLRDNLINYFLEEIDKSGLNLREILQGDYGSFTDSINEKVRVIQSRFSEFETIRDALLGDIEQINNHLNNTFPGIHSSIDNLFGDFETVSSSLEDAKAELKENIASVLSNLDVTNSTLFETIKDLQTTQASLNETKTELTETLNKLNQTKTDLENSIADAQTKLDQTNKELANATGEAKTALENTKTELQNTISQAEANLAKTQEELNKTQAKINATKSELETTISSVREELNGMIADAQNRLNNLLNQFNNAQTTINSMIGQGDGYITNTEISFGNINITTDTSDWGYLPSFDSFGSWTNTWLEKHENPIGNIIFNLKNAREVSFLLVKDMQNIKGFLQTLSAGLSRAQSYINEQLTTLDSGIDEIQNALTEEITNRNNQYTNINNNITTLFSNQSTLNGNLVTLELKHDNFETTTQSSFDEIKIYIDTQINSQIGAIINADY